MKQGYRQQPPADDQHGASHLLRAAFDDKDDDSEEAEKRSDDQRSGNEMAPAVARLASMTAEEYDPRPQSSIRNRPLPHGVIESV